MRRSTWPRLLLAAFFTLAALADAREIASAIAGRSDQPSSLVTLHLCTGLAAVAVVVALLRRSPRAPALVWLWGVLCAVLLLAVPVALEMPRAAWFGILGSVLVVLVLAALGAWAARRVVTAAPTVAREEA